MTHPRWALLHFRRVSAAEATVPNISPSTARSKAKNLCPLNASVLPFQNHINLERQVAPRSSPVVGHFNLLQKGNVPI